MKETCVNKVPNALEINLKAFTRKESPIPADGKQTLTKIKRDMRKQGVWKALFVLALDFYLREWGFPFE